MNHEVLLGRDDGRRILEGLNREPERPCITAHVGWVASDDAVELVRVPIGLQQTLASAARASAPIGMPCLTAIERFYESLGLKGHLVLSAVGKINELLRVTGDEAGTPASVAVIGGARGIAAAQSVGHIVVGNEPPHPPLPMARNLPFQLEAGSQISAPISESALGLS